jgi:hypothetical protein
VAINSQKQYKTVGPHDEPARGSVVLIHGEEGTAVQRFYSDGLWHTAGTRLVRTWTELVEVSTRPVILIYTPGG